MKPSSAFHHGRLVQSHKNYNRSIPSSSSSLSSVHDAKLCKSLPEIISLTNSSPGLQEFGRNLVLSPGFTQPHPRTVSWRSLLFSSLGLSSRTAGSPPRLARFVDDVRWCNAIPNRNRTYHLLTDYLGVRLIPGWVSDWRHQVICWPHLPIVLPGSIT